MENEASRPEGRGFPATNEAHFLALLEVRVRSAGLAEAFPVNKISAGEET
jgi:hypothetical protein